MNQTIRFVGLGMELGAGLMWIVVFSQVRRFIPYKIPADLRMDHPLHLPTGRMMEPVLLMRILIAVILIGIGAAASGTSGQLLQHQPVGYAAWSPILWMLMCILTASLLLAWISVVEETRESPASG